MSQVQNSWMWGDIQASVQKVYKLAMSVNYPVALVVVLARTMMIPPKGFTENSRNIIASHIEAGLHTIVYVSRIPDTVTLWQASVDTFASDSSCYFIARTLEEALGIVDSRAY